MTLNRIKSMAIAAIACVCVAAPAGASAQRYPQDYDRNYRSGNQYGYGVRDLVNRVERESNDFRDYFEHHFRVRGNARRSDRWSDHSDHQGRYGDMTLKDAIQNLDEAMERLRNSVNRNGNTRSRDFSETLSDVLEHSNDVDRRIGRVSDTYDYYNDGYDNGYGNDRYGYGSGRSDDRYGNGRYGDRNWRYDRNDLGMMWRDLRSDIGQLSRMLNVYRNR